MATVLLVIHLLIALALVGVILLQKSEGGALGIGGGGGGGGFMTGRGQASLLTRTTAFLAAGFITTSLLLAIIASRSTEPTSILDEGPAPIGAPVSDQPAPPGGAPAADPPAAPEAPSGPSAPIAN